ncbi:MAG: GreA/GreB family elongation factor [Verrucomicrobiales bacterium]|jgi:transcription elongation GreA/GreB family factor|nr:GreA/GreB family elongation factor [Verrucomicrobiales bacterium]
MDSDLLQTLETLQLTHLAPKLEKLIPNACCEHRSWGVGRIKEWDSIGKKIIIDFAGRPGHAMDFEYATTSLTPLDAEHIEAKKLNDLAAVKALADGAPVTLLQITVRSLGRLATAEKIQAVLSPSVIDGGDWKKWWDGVKRAIRKDERFVVPGRRSEPVVFHDIAPDYKQQALGAVTKAVGPKAQLAAVEQLIKHAKVLDDEALQNVITDIDQTIARTPSSQIPAAVELALGRDELVQEAGQVGKFGTAGLSKFIPKDAKSFVALAEQLTAGKQGKFVARAAEILGDGWHAFAVSLLPHANGRIAEVVIESYKKDHRVAEILEVLGRLIRERKLHYDFLIWLSKNRKAAGFQPLVNIQLFYAMLSVLELDTLEGSRKSGRLQDLLITNKELVKDLLAGAREDEVRDVTRVIMLSPVFDELDKRSLLATLVKLYPFVQAMIIGQDNKSDTAPLVVSLDSLAKRKAELDEIITKKIPDNTRDIAVARSYGDLRENSEFKAAKEMQSVLLRRRAELEAMLLRAQPTDFKAADTGSVNIGTVVGLTDTGSGEQLSYTILGAWDSNPEQGIISYLTPVAQALHKKNLGETADLTLESGGHRQVRIDRISAYNP